MQRLSYMFLLAAVFLLGVILGPSLMYVVHTTLPLWLGLLVGLLVAFLVSAASSRR